MIKTRHSIKRKYDYRPPLLILIILILTLTCNDTTNPSPACELLSIVLWSDFQSDSVEVELDNEIVFSGTVTTDSFGVAWQAQDTVFSGPHLVQIFIPNLGALGDTVISVQTDEVAYEHFVNVYYDRAENELTFKFFIQRGGISKEEHCN